MNLSLGKASEHPERAVRLEFAVVCTAIVRYCWIRLGFEPSDEDVSLVRPLERDPDYRDTKALVLDAIRVLFGRTVVRLFPLERQIETADSTWLFINRFTESMK